MTYSIRRKIISYYGFIIIKIHYKNYTKRKHKLFFTKS